MELLDAWIRAAGDNNVDELATLLAENPTLLDERHPLTGRTALQHASAWDAHDVVRFLLKLVRGLWSFDNLIINPNLLVIIGMGRVSL
jgi:hypothetical protein